MNRWGTKVRRWADGAHRGTDWHRDRQMDRWGPRMDKQGCRQTAGCIEGQNEFTDGHKGQQTVYNEGQMGCRGRQKNRKG